MSANKSYPKLLKVPDSLEARNDLIEWSEREEERTWIEGRNSCYLAYTIALQNRLSELKELRDIYLNTAGKESKIAQGIQLAMDIIKIGV